MNSIKKSFTIARFSYFDWIKDIRQIIAFLILASFVYKCVLPLKKVSNIVGIKMTFGETYIAELNERFVMAVLLFLFLMVISDMPKILGMDYYYFIRSSKRIWTAGQAIFAVFASLTYTMVIILINFVFTFGNTIFTNNWSDIFLNYFSAEYNQIAEGFGIVCYVTGETLNHFRIDMAFINTTLLMILICMLFCFIMMLFNFFHKKIIGILVCGVMIVVGAFTSKLSVSFKWILPMPHAMLSSHNDAIIKEVPIIDSYLYFALGLIGILIVIFLFSKKVSVVTSENE